VTKFKVYYRDPKTDVRGTWKTDGRNPGEVRKAFFSDPVFKGRHILKVKKVKVKVK